jgi:hypothetical protein
MVTLDYFSKLPIKHGLWIKQDTPHEGDTIIIQPQAFMYRYSFTGHAYSEYYQLRPGHIGIVETVDEFVGEPIDLVGKHFDTFYGWHIRFRNANWPAAWMETIDIIQKELAIEKTKSFVKMLVLVISLFQKNNL